MSEYEVKAYKQLTSPPQDSRSLVPQKVHDTASVSGRSVRKRASTCQETKSSRKAMPRRRKN